MRYFMMREQHQRLTEFDWQQDHVDDEQTALQTESRFQADLESHLGVNANATTYRRFANSSDSAWKIVDGTKEEPFFFNSNWFIQERSWKRRRLECVLLRSEADRHPPESRGVVYRLAGGLIVLMSRTSVASLLGVCLGFFKW